MLVLEFNFYVAIGLNATLFRSRRRLHAVGTVGTNSGLYIKNPDTLLIRNTLNDVASGDWNTVTQLGKLFGVLSTLGYTGSSPSATSYARGAGVTTADLAALTTLFTYNGWSNSTVTLALLGGPIS